MSKIFTRTSTYPEFKLDTPTQPTDKIVVFLPGISGGAFSDRFQPIVDSCLNAGLAIARVNAWKNAEDVEKKNLSDIYEDVGNVITYLNQQGYSCIFGVGKSFGGAVMLTLPSMNISKKVLWAPAIGVTESGTNIKTYLSIPPSTLKSLLDLKVDKIFLEKINIPILVIHGTADENIPLSNSEKMVSMLPTAKLISIEGADHSYRPKKHEDAVILATINFLIKGF